MCSSTRPHLAVRLRHVLHKLSVQRLRQQREQRVGHVLFVLLVLRLETQKMFGHSDECAQRMKQMKQMCDHLALDLRHLFGEVRLRRLREEAVERRGRVLLPSRSVLHLQRRDS